MLSDNRPFAAKANEANRRGGGSTERTNQQTRMEVERNERKKERIKEKAHDRMDRTESRGQSIISIGNNIELNCFPPFQLI